MDTLVRAVVILLLPALCAFASQTVTPGRAGPPALTHGVASGDVTAESAILWARASTASTLESEYSRDPGYESVVRGPSVAVTEASDFTGQMVLQGLSPSTRYFYRIRAHFGSERSEPVLGSFLTAPRPEDARDVSFVWGGDLGGQGYCRIPEKGYEILAPMAALRPDFVLFSGDMIYADSPCPSPPNDPGSDFVAGTLQQFRQRWKYNRDDRHFQALLASASMVTQWDDHEVVNDFIGPREPLMPAGRRAYFEFHPITRHPDDPHRLFRNLRWGRAMELFVLDNRQYRAANTEPDGPGKSMLGREQYEWLLSSLKDSGAVWKIIATSVPLTVPTGSNSETRGRDGWADGDPQGPAPRTGWERELTSILEFLRKENVRNVVWITTDVHYAQVARIDPFGDGAFRSLELISGPLSAVRGKPGRLDRTPNPTRLYAEGEFFNFGRVSIDGASHRLEVEIRAAETDSLPALRYYLAVEPDK